MSFATPLKPFRTTAFKLAAGYLIVFGIFATGLIGYLVFETGSVVVRDVDRRLTEDARRLGREYQRGGINALFNAMQLGAQAGSNRLYALLDSEGRALINTIGELPEGIWRESGLARFAYLRVGPDGEVDESRAIVRVIDLPNGFHALQPFLLDFTGVVDPVGGFSAIFQGHLDQANAVGRVRRPDHNHEVTFGGNLFDGDLAVLGGVADVVTGGILKVGEASS